MYCDFCNGPHYTRNCPIEKKLASSISKIVGIHLEYYIANYVLCPYCNMNKLSVLGNNEPSLDIVCMNCDKKYEVKSKCLSVDKLPNNLILSHGSYFDYLRKHEMTLDLLILIYGVDRKSKSITIKKLIHIPSKSINSDANLKIELNKENNKCTIYIRNHTMYNSVSNINHIISYKKEIQELMKN